jgi:hypothetical protein
MSLLHQDNSEELDDAALGEELTRGTSHVIVAGVIAAIVVTLIIAIYVIAGQTPPLATGEVVSVWAHPMHTQTSGFDANGAPMPKESFDQVLVFVQVRLHNQSKQTLVLNNIMTNATMPDGIHTSYAATAGDYDRTFLAYPDLPVPHDKALPLLTAIDPGQTLEGTFVSAFRMTREQWDARKGMNFTFGFRYEPNLVLASPSSIIEQ